MTTSQTVYSSGILADSGDYGFTMSLDEIFELIQAERKNPDSTEQSYVARFC